MRALVPHQGETRVMRALVVILAMFLAGPAAAEDWMEYQYPEFSFTIQFPVAPNVQVTAYQAADGRSFEAHTYSAALDTGNFKMTIADVPEAGTDNNALVGDAVNKLTEGGVIKFDLQHRIRAVYGRQLGVAGANGGYSYIAVFYHKNRLYQIEGQAFVSGGQAEIDAMRFQQSLDFT
jgi:hypothetical protein